MPIQPRSVREKLYYEYAKLISDAAVGERTGLAPVVRRGDRYWSFVAATFRKLVEGQIQWSSVLRENKMLVRDAGQCAYCAAETELHWEHIVPQAVGGPDTIDNLVQACAPCNLSKGARDPVVWYDGNLSAIPRPVMGKLLKLLYEAHERNGTLDAPAYPSDADLKLVNVASIFSRAPGAKP